MRQKPGTEDSPALQQWQYREASPESESCTRPCSKCLEHEKFQVGFVLHDYTDVFSVSLVVVGSCLFFSGLNERS